MARRRTRHSHAELERKTRTDELFRQIEDELDEHRKRDLLNAVVLLNLPVARSIAWKFRGRGCALEDLEQTASLALIRAAEDFDPGRGHHFLTYAVPCISGAVKKYFRDFGWTVRPPRLVQELQQNMEAAGRVVDPATGTGPSPAQMAGLLGVETSAIEEALRARGCFTPTSLDLSLGEGGSDVLGDLLVAPDDGAMGAVEARVVLSPVFARLSPADRSLLTMRFIQERTQQEMAEELGTTQPTISRLLSGLLDEMHAMVTEPRTGATSAA